MLKLTNLTLNKQLEKEIKEYCKLNNLGYIRYVNDIIRRGFMVDKYGEKPLMRVCEKRLDKVVEYTFDMPVKEESHITDNISLITKQVTKTKRQLKIVSKDDD